MLNGLISCSAACVIFLDQGSNPCLLHWQVDSLPLNHLEIKPRVMVSKLPIHIHPLHFLSEVSLSLSFCTRVERQSLEKEMATHSSNLAWEIPWTEEPGGL